MSEIAVIDATTPVELCVDVEVITSLKTRLTGLKADTHSGYELVKAGIAEVSKLRTGVEASRKKFVEPHVAAQKDYNAAAKRAKEMLLAIETPLREEKARVDEEAQRLRDEQEAAERLVIEAQEEKERQAREVEEKAKREAEEQERKAEAARLAEERKALEAERKQLEDERREQQEALEAERLKIVADREEIEKVKRAVEESVRKEREAELAAEREAQEKEERVKKAVAEKLRLSQEKAEAAVLAEARKPDREKLEEMVARLKAFQYPQVTTDWAQNILEVASVLILQAAKEIKAGLSLAGSPDEQSSPSDM